MRFVGRRSASSCVVVVAMEAIVSSDILGTRMQPREAASGSLLIRA